MRESPYPTLPAEVHTPSPLSTHVKRPKLYVLLDRLFPPTLPSYRRRALSVGLLTVTVAVGILLWRWSGWGSSPHPGVEGGFRGGLFTPPVTAEETDTEATDPAVSAEDGDTESPTQPGGPNEPESVSDPESSPPSSSSAETLPPEPPYESEDDPSPPVSPETHPEEATQPPSPETQSPTVNTESPTESPTEPATESSTEPVTEPVPVPDGCFPIISADLSEPLRGAGYIHNEGATLPTALPADSPWQVNTPAVLIVNTHPYEGYHDGSPWYDPTQGGLAQTDSPNAPDGVVALGVALTRALRDRGVTVIHLRIPTTPEESSANLYDRTEAMIRYYCRLYPDIGLVLDLRRSAELTETGEILRTEGTVNGVPTAQLRITVNGGREPRALGHDLTVALALRESLWEESPALSRPVRVKSGSGLVSDLTELRVLTLETGSAGNTYAEAARLVPPLARALEQILIKFS